MHFHLFVYFAPLSNPSLIVIANMSVTDDRLWFRLIVALLMYS